MIVLCHKPAQIDKMPGVNKNNFSIRTVYDKTFSMRLIIATRSFFEIRNMFEYGI